MLHPVSIASTSTASASEPTAVLVLLLIALAIALVILVIGAAIGAVIECVSGRYLPDDWNFCARVREFIDDLRANPRGPDYSNFIDIEGLPLDIAETIAPLLPCGSRFVRPEELAPLLRQGSELAEERERYAQQEMQMLERQNDLTLARARTEYLHHLPLGDQAALQLHYAAEAWASHECDRLELLIARLRCDLVACNDDCAELRVELADAREKLSHAILLDDVR